MVFEARGPGRQAGAFHSRARRVSMWTGSPHPRGTIRFQSSGNRTRDRKWTATPLLDEDHAGRPLEVPVADEWLRAAKLRRREDDGIRRREPIIKEILGGENGDFLVQVDNNALPRERDQLFGPVERVNADFRVGHLTGSNGAMVGIIQSSFPGSGGAPRLPVGVSRVNSIQARASTTVTGIPPSVRDSRSGRLPSRCHAVRRWLEP